MGPTVRIALVVASVLLLAMPVAAMQVVVPVDVCVGVDHSGDNPFGSPSAARAFITVDPSLSGGEFEAVVEGPTGEVTVVGEVGVDGLVVLEIPLSQYGDHAITTAVVNDGSSATAIDVGSLAFVVDAEEPTCNPGDLVYVTPETTTTVLESTTTVPPAETTTTRPESTTTSVVESTTTTVAATPAPDDGEEPSGGWVLPIFGGLILIIGGAIVWRRPDDPCKEQLEAWRAAQAACDAANTAAAEARTKCTEAETRVEDLEDQRKDICKEWPPACWDSDDGGWIEESGRPETRITQRDLHLRREALGDVWEQYQSGEMTAEQVEEVWKRADTPEFREDMRAKDAAARARLEQLEARVAEAREAALKACAEAESAEAEAKAACERAASAKAAYDACMNAAAPPPAEPAPPIPPTAPTPPPTGPGVAPPPTDPGSTRSPEEEDDEDPVCCPEGNWVGYGWTTGGIFGFGVESTIAHFICLCDTGKWITMASRSLRAGLALGGETSLFVAYMWGVEHTAKVPVVWADKSAGGWDFDISLGPSVTKGLKTVAKDVGKGAGWDYLKWAARNKVAPSDLDPRRIGEVVGGAKGLASSAAQGAAKDVAVGQQFDPQLIVVPVGVGLQVGVWHKWCESVRVSNYRSCGCTPIDWP